MQVHGAGQVESLERQAAGLGQGGRMRIRITQEAFDEAVKETMDDFEMEFEEALQETIDQFKTQGVDLTGLRLDDPELRAESGKALQNAVSAIRSGVEGIEKGENVDGVKEGLLAAFKTLEREADNEERRDEANSHGAIPALCGTFMTGRAVDDEIITEAMRVMCSLFKSVSNRESLSQSAVNYTFVTMRQQPSLTIDAIKMLTAACHKDEPNKNRVEAADDRYVTLNQVIEAGDAPEIKAACELVRKLVTRDDTREMMDNCFNRSKALKNCGVLAAISKLLGKYREDMETMPIILACLANTCLQQETIDVLVSNNMVDLAVELLRTHMENQAVAENAIAMVAALAQSDKPKKVIGEGQGLGLLMMALDRYRGSGRVVLRVLKALGHITLRATDNATRLHEMEGIPLILDVARMYSCINSNPKVQAANAKIQCALMLLIRNMLSHNKELIPVFMEEGIEEQVRIQSVHPDVNQSAFNTLKELECNVPLREEWTGQKGDLFKQGDGEVNEGMKEFLSEYRDENARNMIDQAGMSDQLDVNALPKMGGVHGAEDDKPCLDDSG